MNGNLSVSPSANGYRLETSGQLLAQHTDIWLKEHAGMVSGNLKDLDTL